MKQTQHALVMLFVALCACSTPNKPIDEVQPQEKEVWKGLSKISWETGDFVQIAPSEFDSLKVGDEIVVDFEYVGDDNYPMVSLFDGEWDNMSGSGRICIDSTMTSVTYTVTKNMLESVSFSGLALTGVAYNLKGVKIVKKEAPEDIENAVWYGSIKMTDDWQTLVNISDKTFYEAQEGDIMRLYFSEYIEKSEFSSHTGLWNSIAEHDVITSDHFDRVLTHDLLELLRAEGYNFNGAGFTVHKLEFVHPE